MYLQRIAHRIVFASLLVGCLFIASAYSWYAIRGYRASRLSRDSHEDSLRRAIALEPRNASAYNGLCRYRMNVDLDPASAVTYCEQATELNRYNSSYWLDLASAFYGTGQKKEEFHAIESAVAVDPTTPEVAWNAANLYLVAGELEPALNQFAVVLKNDPDLAPQALKLCWQSVGKTPEPIVRILPPDPVVYLQFLRLLTSENESEAARRVWSMMYELNRPFDYHDALFYVDTLLASRDVAFAEQVWRQLAARSATFSSYQRSDQNLVVNGSFEGEILNTGFDWRIVPLPGTAVSLDSEATHEGSRSFMISFSQPVIDAGLFQLVPVATDTEYTASAWMKSKELQTANGPRLTASDAYTNAPLGMSEETSGTTGWHNVNVTFRTGPETKLVALRFARERGDTVVRGRIWIANVHLTTGANRTGAR